MSRSGRKKVEEEEESWSRDTIGPTNSKMTTVKSDCCGTGGQVNSIEFKLQLFVARPDLGIPAYSATGAGALGLSHISQKRDSL